MKTSNSDSTTPVRQDSYSLDEDASQAQRVDEGSPSEAGVSPAPSRDAPQTGKAGNAAIEPTPGGQRSAAAASPRGPSGGTVSARATTSRSSGKAIPTAVALSGRATGDAPSTKPSADGANIETSGTLPGATLEEFTELNNEFDTADGYSHANSERNVAIEKRMEVLLEQEMTGYPPDVVQFEQRHLVLRRLLVDMPRSQREFYGSALATLSTAYALEADPTRRVAILEKALDLDGAVRNAYPKVINDPVDRALGIFNPPMGEAYLDKEQREDVDRLERLREDFFDAADPAERKAIFGEAAELKEKLQRRIDLATRAHLVLQRTEWGEANAEVDRILREAEAQTDPAKRYELIGRQLFQINPGQDRLKDKVVLAFTQRMRDSQELRTTLNKWHTEVTAPLNAHSVGGPKRYTDILKSPPPVNADYVRDLSDQYTDILSDASHRNYSITPKARAEKLAGQILEGVMRVLLEITPLGILGDLIPSTLPDNVRMGLEFGGMLLDALTGVGLGKQVGRGAKAIAAAARQAEDLAGTGVRAGAKGLADDAADRIVKGTLADQTLSPQAKAAAEALEKKALAEAGPPVDPTSELAHEAVGISPYQSLSNYADPDVVPGNLRRGSQPGILEDSAGNRYIELGGKAYHVRFDPDNVTWRVFYKGASWKPQYAVRLNETTHAWEVHGDVGLLGGGKRISDSVKQEIVRLLNEREMSQARIASETRVAEATVNLIAKKLNIGQSARHIPPATIERAIELLKEGELTHSAIARKLKISRQVVDRLAKANNIAPKAVGNQRIAPETRRQVKKLIAETDLSNSKIARKVGISRFSVANIRGEMRSPPDAFLRARRITPTLREEIVKQLKEGATRREVAQTIGTSRSTVRTIARDAEVPAGGTRQRVTPEQIDQVFALRDQRKSVREVATTVGLSERTVRDIYANVNANTYKRSWWDTTPEKRTAVLRQLDQGRAAKDIAVERGLPLETVRGIANQQRMARDSLARELLSQGQSAEEVAEKLGISPEYVRRLRQGVPEGTHDIHDIRLNSEDGAVAEDMFKQGYTREDVAEKLGIPLWNADRLANEYRTKTMDSVMPKQLADMVAALNDRDYCFTTGDLARASGLPETTVLVIEHEYGMGSIIQRPGSPQPGPSHAPGRFGGSYEWVRPLTVDQEVQAIRALDDGQDLRQVAEELHVDPPAIERLYEEDVPLVAPADDPVAAPPAGTPAPAARPLTEADKAEIRNIARNGYSPEFIAGFVGRTLEEVNKVLL
ncbi:ArsR family transcriptional regulator [Paraburkholderia aromaticivorans]|uniref:ArsR family transcriptional regulator n=1 Tax=Paraburkholderia aromaticivorans TaxID=2026199 RepID=UPI0014560C20|nr:ArsR family transcriptional regulator [Paraburkholderia aromaticivorans]